MAPRPPESKAAFIERLRRVAHVDDLQLRFGAAHHTHAVCRDGERWTVRRLELDPADADAYLKQHGMFMPEHAEMLAKPGAVVLEAGSLDSLIAAIEAGPWPMSR